MPFESLRDFMEALDSAVELKRISTKVSPDLEVVEIPAKIDVCKRTARCFIRKRRRF